ncbi:MAG: hypothetical protein ACREJR_13555 [Candidatus Rokuibacteriota bacterium]
MDGRGPERCPLGVNGGVSLEPHLLPHEMAHAMEADAAFLGRAGWVR